MLPPWPVPARRAPTKLARASPTCRGELRQSTPTSSCLPPGATRKVSSSSAQERQQISRRTVGVAAKPGKEPASMRPQCLDKKPRRLITQTEHMRNRSHARRRDSAPARTLGVVVEMGKELASMHPQCDRQVRPLSPRTNPMRKRRAPGAAVNIDKGQPSLHPRCLGKKPRPRKQPTRNGRRTDAMSVCSECRPTAYGKAQASVRPQCLDKKQPRPLSPRRK